MNRKNVLLGTVFVLVFLSGLLTMRLWENYQRRTGQARQHYSVPSMQEPVQLVDLREGQLPKGVEYADKEEYVDDSSIPSQLVKIKVSGVSQVISRSGTQVTPEESAEGRSSVYMGDANYAAVPMEETKTQALPEPESKISMIEAPVAVKLIKTLDDYKAFKRVARGDYPVVDFSQDDVLVLESTSNLPDKVFEIQDVVEENGSMVVIYRVNIFGLDQKTNTHSAVRISKRDLPIKLKQIL